MPDLIVSNSNPDVVELPTAFGGPPEQIHPGQIDYASFNDNPALKRASDTLKFGWDTGAAINDLRTKPNDEDRAATHDRRVRERADDSQRAWVEQLTGAMNDVKAELRRVESGLEAKSGLKSNPVQFDAITAAFHGMKPGQRAETLADLIEQGEHSALATLAEAPLFLTGLTAEQRDSIKVRVLTKVDAQGLKLRDQLAKTLEKIDAAGIASMGMFDKLRAGTHPGAWKERAKMAAARNAHNRV